MDESKTRGWTNFRLQRGTDAPDALESADPPIQSTASAPATRTFFEAGAIFEGTLKLTGDFRIDSEFRGELSTDGSIHVGPSGSIEGNIEARQVEIEGAVVGDVRARRMLVLRSNGRLHGNIETACLEIERHAFFQGGTKMIQPLANNRADADATAPASPASAAPNTPTS